MKKQYKVVNVNSNEVLFTGTNWGKANQFAYDMLTQESGIGVNLQIFEVAEDKDLMINDWIGYKYSTGKIRMTKKEVADRLMKNSKTIISEKADVEAQKKAEEAAELARQAEKEAIRKQKKREADARYRAKKKAQKLAALAAMNAVK